MRNKKHVQFPLKNIISLALITLFLLSIFTVSYSVKKSKKIETGLGAIPGDCEGGDGDVDILDFQALSNTFAKTTGQTGYNAACNFNTDPMIEILDYQLLSNNFGRTGVTISPTTTTVPTITPGGQTVTVIAAGDIACGPDTVNGICKEWATSELIRQTNPAAVLPLGDTQYEAGQLRYFNGTDPFCQSNPPRCYNATWGRFKSISRPAVGNHEYGTPGAAGYFDYFNGANMQSGLAGDRNKGYYSYNLGSWHVVVLNSQCDKAGGCQSGSAQEAWLRADLAANPRTCTLAYMHYSKFSSGHHGNQTSITSPLTPLWNALYNANADVVLGGHSHDYERFAPQSPSGTLDNNRGIRQFVIGTGGRDFTGWAWSAPNSQIKQNNTFGVLKLTLKSGSYDWQFLPIAGSTWTDSGSSPCH